MSTTEASYTLIPNAAKISKERGPCVPLIQRGHQCPCVPAGVALARQVSLMDQLCLPVLSNEVKQHAELSQH